MNTVRLTLEMFVKGLKLALVATAVTLLGFALDTDSAKAASIMITDADGLKWNVTWDTPQNGVTVDFKADPNNGDANKGSQGRTDGSVGTFIKTVTYPKDVFSTIDITFTQMDQGNANLFGLRFTMNEVVTNNTGKAWTGFTETLEEKKDPSDADKRRDPADSAHPWFAHFHKDRAFTAADGTTTYPGFDGTPFTPNDFNAKDTLTFGGGTLADDGTMWKPTGIGIHERTYADAKRVFILHETPIVAEPASLTLLGLGGLGLVGYGWWKRRRASL